MSTNIENDKGSEARPHSMFDEGDDNKKNEPTVIDMGNSLQHENTLRQLKQNEELHNKVKRNAPEMRNPNVNEPVFHN